MQRFEWDPKKAASNFRKHGIHFVEALRAFADPFAFTEEDSGDDGEVRWQLTGVVSGMCLVLVIYTLREGDNDEIEREITRIISARRANRGEQRRYDDNLRAVHGRPQ